MVTRMLAMPAVAVLLAAPAAAGQLPSWDINEICRGDSAPGQCRLAEGRARSAVTGSWGVLLPTIQAACLDATRAPADQSWRELAGCIEIKTLNGKQQRAMATRITPSQPEPAQEPAAASDAPSASKIE